MLITGLGLSGTPRVMMDLVENLPRHQYEISVAYKPEFPGFEGDLLDALKTMGIETVALRGSHLLSMEGLLDLFNHLRARSTRIVHCFDDLCVAGRLMKPLTGCRVIETFGNPVTSKGSLPFYFLNKMTSTLMDGVIFVSGGVEKSFRASDVLIFRNGMKTKVIPNCIHPAELTNPEGLSDRVKSKWKLDGKTQILTNAGLFNEQKAQAHLIRALPIIIEDFPDTKLMLVGWGPLEQDLKAQIEKSGLQGHVIFTGKIPHDEVYDVLAITDIFVLSSLWEGFGLVMGEAMAMGKPVVATRTDGSELLIVDGKTGRIVPPRDYRSLARAVIGLLQDPTGMREMGRLGRDRIQSLFSPETFRRNYESIYREILQPRTFKTNAQRRS